MGVEVAGVEKVSMRRRPGTGNALRFDCCPLSCAPCPTSRLAGGDGSPRASIPLSFPAPSVLFATSNLPTPFHLRADQLVETASLASVALPPPNFQHRLQDCVDQHLLSDAQVGKGFLSFLFSAVAQLGRGGAGLGVGGRWGTGWVGGWAKGAARSLG